MSLQDSEHLAGGFFWNTVASALNALQGVVFLAVVNRVAGPYLGGVFSFAYMIGQQFRPLGAFEMRVYQATDVKCVFSFGTYLLSRAITALLMIAAIVVTSLSSEGATLEGITVIFIALLRVLDVVEDVFHGKLQQMGRLDIAARAQSIRIIVTSLLFCLGVLLTGDLLLSAFVSLVVSAFTVYCLNVPASRRQFDIHAKRTDLVDLPRLFVTCVPLFLAAFLSGYLPNASKFAVEAVMSKESLTQYSVLFVPAMVINLACGFVFQPLLSHLANSISHSDNRPFLRLISKGVLLSMLVGLLAMVGAGLVGIPLLELVYGIDLDGLWAALIVLMLAGMFNAFDTVMYYGLVALRAQKLVLIDYALVALGALLCSGQFVARFNLFGAALSYAAVMIGFFVLSLISMYFVVGKGR